MLSYLICFCRYEKTKKLKFIAHLLLKNPYSNHIGNNVIVIWLQYTVVTSNLWTKCHYSVTLQLWCEISPKNFKRQEHLKHIFNCKNNSVAIFLILWTSQRYHGKWCKTIANVPTKQLPRSRPTLIITDFDCFIYVAGYRQR